MVKNRSKADDPESAAGSFLLEDHGQNGRATKLLDEIRNKQNALFESYHVIVLPSIVLNTMANIEAAITNGSFETLLQLLKTHAEVRTHAETNESNDLKSPSTNKRRRRRRRTHGDSKKTVLYKTIVTSIDNLRKFTSSYPKVNDDKEILLKQIEQQLQDLMKNHFQKFIPDKMPTIDHVRSLIKDNQDSLAQWCSQPDIAELDNLVRQMNSWENSRTIAQPKTPLQNAKIHLSLTIMMKSIDEFEPFLKTILEKCGAFNERIQCDLDTPLHYAIRSQNTGYIEWLLEQPSLDVNCRNKQMKTALFVLCEQYKAALRNKTADFQEKYRQHILLLLARGADFNICSSKALLPYEFLTQNGKSNNQVHSELHEFFVQCGSKAQQGIGCPILKRSGNKFTTEQFGAITIELLEIFLRFKDLDMFKKEFQKLEVQNDDVCKVVTLLLHPAVELNLQNCVDLIVARFEKPMFATVPGKPFLKHRVELKGLLRKACDSGNPDILKKLLCKMEKDKLLINDESILVHTLNRCASLSDESECKANLLKCAKLMATDPRIFHSKTDCYGNTALHLALKFGFTEIAKALITDHKFMFLGAQNNRDETILDLASYEFCNDYFDACTKQIHSGETLIDLNGINPYVLKKSHDHYIEVPKVRAHKESHRRNFRSEMACLEMMANSRNLKQLLHHPVIYTFILIKWLRFSMWHCFNLILMIAAGLSFSWFSIELICHDNFSITLYIVSWCGLCCVLLRELLQWIIFGSAYFRTIQNWMDMFNILGMLLVLFFMSCPMISSLVVIVFAIQIIQLIGSLPFNSISTYRGMFRVVALNFIKSIALFCPLLLAFACSFYLYYNDKQAPERRNVTEGQYPFASPIDTTIKIMVMASGEFDASSMNINGTVFIIFLLFIFCIPMVMQNLINGLAVSEISEIRKESESISLSEKVQLLSQFESGLNRNSTHKAISYVLEYLRILSPGLFFRNYHHIIKIVGNEKARIMIDPRHSRQSFWEMPSLSSRQSNSSETMPRSPSPNSPPSRKQKPSKDRWKSISRIPALGLCSPIATLEGTVLEELLSIVSRKNDVRSRK